MDPETVTDRDRSRALRDLWTNCRAVERIDDRDHVLYEPGDANVRWLAESGLGHQLAFLRWLTRLQRGSPPRLLELGANPYLLTAAIAHELPRIAIVAGGYPGTDGGPRSGEVVLGDQRSARETRLPLVLFDVDEETFPLDDGRFDVVICGELIEHMATGPAHLLAEIHRVLAPNGWLLLSTPSAVSIAAGIAWLHNRSIYWPYSAQGIHARHNREYTMGELDGVLAASGFAVRDREFVVIPHSRAIYSSGPVGTLKYLLMRSIHDLPRLPIPYLREKADGLLLLAQREEAPTGSWPSSVYGGADSVPMAAHRLPDG